MISKLLLKYPKSFLISLYALIGCAVYSRVILNAGFLGDDFGYIVENPLVREIDKILSSFGDPRQIGYLSFALNYLFAGENPFGFHLVNVVIHISNAVLVFFLISRLLYLCGWRREQRPELFFLLPASVGLIFLVHPLQTQAVSYVTQRFASLSTFFYLAAVTLYLNSRRVMIESASRKRPITYWLSLLCAVLAMKVKEISFTLPLAILVLEMLLLNGTASRKSRVYLVAPFIAAMLLIPISLFGPDWGLTARSAGIAETSRILKIEDLSRSQIEYFATQMRVLVIYLRLLFFPYRQSAVYDLPASHGLFEFPVLVSLALHLFLAAAAVYIWRLSRKEDPSRSALLKLAALGIGWFYLTASVESSVIPIKDLIFEHRAYLPGIGIIITFCSGLALLISSGKETKRFLMPLAGLFLLIAIALGTIAYFRNLVWINEFDYWSDVIAKSPNKASGYKGRANALTRAGRIDEAFADINAAINIMAKTSGQPLTWENADDSPDNVANVYINRADLFRQRGEFENAEADMKTAKNVNSRFSVYWNRKMAQIYSDKGAYPRAIELYNEILEKYPDDSDTVLSRGIAYSMSGSYDKAMGDFNELLRHDPESPLGYYNRGVVYVHMQNLAQAFVDMENSCRLGFSLACTWTNKVKGEVP